MSDKRLVRVELTYSDGERAWLEGEDAQRWRTTAGAALVLAHAHGADEVADLAWQTERRAGRPDDHAMADFARRVRSFDMLCALEEWWRANVPNVGLVPYSDEASTALMALIRRVGEAKKGK